MATPTFSKIRKLTNSKNNITKLLNGTEFNSVNALMNAVPEIKTKKQAHDVLLKIYNNSVELQNRINEPFIKLQKQRIAKEKREIKKTNKRDEVIRNVIKQNQENYKRVQNKKELRLISSMKTFDVIIDARYDEHWTSNNKTIHKNQDYHKTFNTNENNLVNSIQEFLSGYYPFEDEYRSLTLVSYTFQILLNKPIVNKLDVPMKHATPLKLSFLKYIEDINKISYENHDGECVLRILQDHLKIKKEKTITDVMHEASLKLYKKEWNKKDGITARMISYFCEVKNIPCLGLDQKNKMFVKFARDENKSKKYCSLIFYMCVGHFYIINNIDAVREISQTFKENNVISTSILGIENIQKEFTYIKATALFNELYSVFINDEEIPTDFNKELEIIQNLESGTVVLYEQGNLNEELKMYISITNDCPKIKLESLSNVKQFRTNKGVILSTTDCVIDSDIVQEMCNKENIKYNNQSIGTLNNDLLEIHFGSKRIRFNKEERNAIKENQNGLCNLCQDKISRSFEIDHIRPLSNGGNNETANLQALCVSCHQEKTKEENLNCEHHKVKDYISYYNIEAYNAIKSKFFSKVQFSEYLISELEIVELQNRGLNMYSIDDNKCRRNILLNYGFNFPVYSCLDNIRNFNGEITDGNYYIETDNVFPLRKNGFYSRPMVEYCLKQNIISKFDIKYEYKPSLEIKSDYFKTFVEYLMQVYPEEFHKLSVNSLIGMFGRRDHSFIDHKICLKDNIQDMDEVYSNYKRPFVNDINDDYCIVTEKNSIDKLESSYPIYSQILDCEAIELHKKTEMLKKSGCIPICVKTDAVVYFSEKPLNIDNYFWDEEKTVLKYKHEEPALLKKSIQYFNEDKFKSSPIKYNIVEDTKEFNFNVHVAKQIVNSKQSWLLNGPPGSGKTKLINEIIKEINDDKSILRLTPTNVSALLIGGETINKFAHTHLNNSKALKKLRFVKNIMIDEVSMMRELFYSVFLSIKFHYPHINFIISGDFNQLEPVNDRKHFNYEHSKALYELVGGSKVDLTLCRRSDDKLFNLCKNINEGKEYNVDDLINKPFKSYTNICFTNKRRIKINEECMNRYLKENSGLKTCDITKLSYDKNTQDYKLCKGMPLISRVNMSSLEVFNNETFICNKINDLTIEVSNGLKSLTIEKKIFSKLFLLGFCITTHKSQGMSLDEKYCIHEFDRFYKKLKYVALSRATKYEHINIVANK
jgi:hypothetical protein